MLYCSVSIVVRVGYRWEEGVGIVIGIEKGKDSKAENHP